MLKFTAAMLVTLGVARLAGQPALAQNQPPRTAPEVRGVVRAVDAARNSLTVTIAGRGRGAAQEKSYTVARDAEVHLDEGRGRRFVLAEGKLADLRAGALVTLTLTRDGKEIESIVAEGPSVQGTVKAVDTARNTITLTLPGRRGEDGEEKTYSLGKKAEVVLDDGRGRRFSLKEGKLTDLRAGALATLKLSLDQKTVDSIVAEGPNVFGIVKAVDTGKSTITLLLRQGRGDDTVQKTIPLAKDADVLLEAGGRRFFGRLGKLGDLHPGTVAVLKMSLDQKTAVMIRAEGPTVYGTLKKVDAAKGTVTVLVGAGRNSDGEEKTVTLGKKAKVFSEGQEVKLDELKGKAGVLVAVKLSLDQKVATQVALPRE
jgi:hypothetical protein